MTSLWRPQQPMLVRYCAVDGDLVVRKEFRGVFRRKLTCSVYAYGFRRSPCFTEHASDLEQGLTFVTHELDQEEPYLSPS